ncbi:MAG: CBS domain-containing protein [Saprospiraceae bacterium]|nr:CBS domain-containing protein [Saprospiraceae bacterium]
MYTIRHILQLKGDFVWSISPNATVLEAIRMMSDKGAGALVVLDDERMVGIISERDYARKVILKGKSSKDTRVSEIMTTTVFTIHPDETVEEAMDIMVKHHIRHLPVVDDAQVVGVISIMDTTRNVIYSMRQMIRDLEDKMLS